MLDMRRLEVLAHVVRAGSLAAAARSLDITPSAVSQAISALEKQSGVALLERGGRGTQPTPEGERLAMHAEALLAQMARAQADLASDTGTPVRIGVFATGVMGILPRALAYLQANAPQVKVLIEEMEPTDARSALRRGRIDLALVNHHATATPDTVGDWQITHLLDEDVLAAVPADHPAAGDPVVRISALRDSPWIMQRPASPCQELVQRVCAAAGYAPDVVATCGDYRAILALVGAGRGVSLVPQLALVGLARGDAVIRPTRPAVRRRINALLPTKTVTSKETLAVLEAIVEASALISPAGGAAGQVSRRSVSSPRVSPTRPGTARIASNVPVT